MKPEFLILHHSASRWGCGRIIDSWHKERGFDCIGYHFVILNGYPNFEDFANKRKWSSLDGTIEIGRPLDKDDDIERNEIGAHAVGLNSKSISICVIHNDGRFTYKQKNALGRLSREIVSNFDILLENVKGHCEVDSKKPLCPGIDMDYFRNNNFNGKE